MIEAPLYWVKQIQDTLIEAKAIPLSGAAPAFPWESLAAKLATYLQAPELKIQAHPPQFLSAEAVTSGLGAGAIPIAIELTPLSGQAFWLMGKEDIAKLTHLALMNHSGNKGFTPFKFQEGFYYFLATQALAAIDELQAFKDLAPKLSKFSSLPQEQCFCMDVEIQHPETTLWGRLVCPVSFHQLFKAHFASVSPPALTSSLAQHITVSLRSELGQTTLPLSQWKGVSVGDFILLDRCTFDPKSQKGTVTLTLERTPLLRARIKDSNLKIVDYAFYEEHTMNDDLPQDEENPSEFFDAEDLSSTEMEHESDQEEMPSEQQDQMEKMISRDEIPLTLTVEVARIQMNLSQLLQLAPGNILELSVRPEQGVDVTIGGKKVAKAELIKLGEMIGIKILQIGE
jgi:flagellar motor switch protein FliN/FliY